MGKPMKSDQEYDNLMYTSSSQPKYASFFIGLILLLIGIFLIFQNTILTQNFTLVDVIGFNPPFGLVLLPLIIGIGMLFYKKNSILGWILIIFGIITILLGILMGLKIYFKPVTLYVGILMFGLVAAGAGLTLRGLFSK
ncbi:MAG: hypothetical protein H7Y18_03745 [Clostridiaceae bacterium]|nr:hypothetical protein [Clostridiaceae bacterium]